MFKGKRFLNLLNVSWQPVSCDSDYGMLKLFAASFVRGSSRKAYHLDCSVHFRRRLAHRFSGGFAGV
jgi:hypothetical protein